jgi:hypothetical protein
LDSIAVDDMARAPPSAIPASQGMPANRASSVATRVLTSTCASAKAEHDALHAVQPRQREFEADAEHQEHHAELGQVARLLGVRHPARGMRPEGGADQQVSHVLFSTSRMAGT